jgi:ribosomal protein S18 acetylase RimI-like enzyme
MFQHVAPDDRTARVANALRLAQQGELEAAGILIVRGRRGLLGAMVCMPVPGASALVWPPQAVAGKKQQPIEDQLLRHAKIWLQSRGAKIAQTLLGQKEVPLAASLARNGFTHITRLWYMRHELRLSDRPLTQPCRFTYKTYRCADPAVFHQTLLRTYQETRDCPEVNGVRTVEEILEGHRAQGSHDPDCWWLALENDRPVGVLLLTRIPERHGWDVSYLGEVPEARRRGIGTELTRQALLEAANAGAQQMTLAVDARNQPAWDLYHRLGFETFDQREVYLAIW